LSPAPVGIRREDKNRWERRAPLTPQQVAELVAQRGIRFRVQPSDLRVFPDTEYEAAGAELSEDLSPCRIVLGVKEIPVEKLAAGKTYLYFSHTIKGQAVNMPALARMLALGSTLLDYERIVDAEGRRLIFFGRHAGHAGMIDALWALGRRLRWEGIASPFEHVRRAYEYADFDRATDHVSALGQQLRDTGLSDALRPVVVAFTGSGHVTHGASEVLERLPFLSVLPAELPELAADADRPRNVVYSVQLQRKDRYRRREGGELDPGELMEHPERYESALPELLPHITVLVNGVYWHPRQPRLVSLDHLRSLWAAERQPKLRVLADITCDVGGSIEANLEATDPGDPVYVWEPATGRHAMGVEGAGPVVLAVDNLPCELPREASERFGDSLQRFLPALVRCDWTAPRESLDLPPELGSGLIAHAGRLAPEHAWLAGRLPGAEV
jgi:alpha-aminoadipic semialdehyde synthase